MIGPRSRRRLLCGLGGVGAAGLLAGCSDGSTREDAAAEGEGDTTPAGTGQVTEGPTDDAPNGGGEGNEAGSDAGDGDELDLAEANVVGVEVEPAGPEGSYEFAVTLHHDDDGEDGYADWWQVETLGGARLGRRELAHAHSRQPFTRSATIEVGSASCVVVRGHDQSHGYGGRAVAFDLDSTRASGLTQGTEPRSFGDTDCPCE